MKTRILKWSFALAVVVAAGYTAYTSQTKTQKLNGITLDNVEAIASGEDENRYKLCPCPSRPGSECRSSSQDRPTCPYPTYC